MDPSYIDPWVPGLGGSTRTASAAEAIAIARLIIQDKRPGQSVFVSNSAPYIVELENGSSTQAPMGFVRSAMIVGRAELRKRGNFVG